MLPLPVYLSSERAEEEDDEDDEEEDAADVRECFDPVWIASAADAFPAASLVMVSRDFLFDTLTLFSQAMTPFSSPDAIDTLFCSRLRHSQSSHSPKESSFAKEVRSSN